MEMFTLFFRSQKGSCCFFKCKNGSTLQWNKELVYSFHWQHTYTHTQAAVEHLRWHTKEEKDAVTCRLVVRRREHWASESREEITHCAINSIVSVPGNLMWSTAMVTPQSRTGDFNKTCRSDCHLFRIFNMRRAACSDCVDLRRDGLPAGTHSVTFFLIIIIFIRILLCNPQERVTANLASWIIYDPLRDL